MQKWLRGLQHRLIQSRAVLLVGCAIALAIAVPATQYYFTQAGEIRLAKRELSWDRYVRPLIPLMQLLQLHECNLLQARGGDKAAALRLGRIAGRINRRIQHFNPINQKLSAPLHVQARWNIFTHDWKNITANQTRLPRSTMRARYAALRTNLWTTIVHSADSAQVITQGSPAALYQIDVLRMQIPAILVRLTAMQDLILGRSPGQDAAPALKHQLRELMDRLDAAVFTTRSDLVHALSLQSTPLHNFTKSLDELVVNIRAIRKRLRDTGYQVAPGYQREAVLRQLGLAALHARRVYGACARNLTRSAADRVTHLWWRFVVSLVITVILAVSVLLLFLALYRSMKTAMANQLGAERNLRRANNLYATLSQTNELIARHCEPDKLFTQICEIAVKYGGFALALIAEKDTADGDITISAAHGEFRQQLRDFLDTSHPELISPSNPIIRAFTMEEPVVNNHLKVLSDVDLAATFGTMGLNSAGIFPLRRNGKIAAVLAVYALAENFFDSQVSGLLIEMSHAISFALDDMDREKHRRSTEQALRDSELRYHLIMESAGDAIILMDDTGHIIDLNRRAAEQFGYTRSEMLESCGDILFPQDIRQECMLRQKGVLESGQSINTTVTAMRKDNTTFPVELAESRVVFQGNPLLLGIFRDISERKLAEDRIRYLAYHDALTDLPNRMLLNDRLGQTIRHARRHDQIVGVIFLDLDNFKNVNDTLGHDSGDDLLKMAAQRIKSSLREADTVARLGGDEFVVLLPAVPSEAEVNRVAEKILEAMNVPFVISGHTFHVTCSMGLSLFPRDGTDCSDLLRNADEALYRAKKDGRNCLAIHSPELHAATVENLWMENDLRLALARNELSMHYQPQVDLNSGRIIGAEALLRWQHPTRGLISPVKFIPLAEDKGLMPVLGEWILKTACNQIRLWQDAGLPVVPVAVNLSALQCREPGLPDTVRRVLKDSGIDPTLLELEITEGTLMAQTDVLCNRMVEIKKTGIRFSLDDFGIGYSSLSYLTRFPIDTLKIDISFVRGMMDDPKDLAVVDTIIDLADNLQLRTVAEGVEKEEQLTLLRLLGCQSMQGYFFSKPLPAAEFAEFLRTGKCLPAPSAMSTHPSVLPPAVAVR